MIRAASPRTRARKIGVPAVAGDGRTVTEKEVGEGRGCIVNRFPPRLACSLNNFNF